MTPNEPELIDAGAESEVYITRGANPFVIKRRRPNGKIHYDFEAYAYERLKSLGAKVPTVLSYSDDELVMNALAGEELDGKSELYDNTQLFSSIAKDLALCRRVTFEGFGPAVASGSGFKGPYKTWRDYLMHIYKQLDSSKVLNRQQKNTLEAYWNVVVPEIKLDKGMLVHGDFAMSAIFVNGSTYEGLIDFGDAFIGDPLMDLAYFRFKEINKPCGAQLYSRLLDGYLANVIIDRAYAEKVVNAYMIYWVVLRVHASHLDHEITEKFLDKTNVLINLLAQPDQPI